ncbi:alpha-methylacyl-CoA racemase [Naviculisporaceae sp. PSN 640]
MSASIKQPPPLKGIKVLEFAGLAPGPFAGLLLADAGASVLRIDRPSSSSSPSAPTADLLTRHKSSLPLDLKSPSSRPLLLSLIRQADVLIDPFRPGVLEKLGLGPDFILQKINPRLIYARMTGFRRDGRYKYMAGHDINYLAVSGVLSMLGTSKKRLGGKPSPPINILGDFAGGGAVLFQGILMALLARDRNGDGSGNGKGQVVEANMVDGAGYLATFPRFARNTFTGNLPRGENLLDGGCPYYDVYETKNEEEYMAVGALEPQFFKELLQGLGLQGQGWETKRYDRAHWDELRTIFEKKFKEKTRQEWEAIFDGTDACCTPVLGYHELEEGKENGTREGDQRPVVTLTETPLLAVSKGKGGEEDVRRGQGPGVEGEGYVGRPLNVGEGGKEILNSWLGWVEGREFKVEDGGNVVLLKGTEKGAKL